MPSSSPVFPLRWSLCAALLLAALHVGLTLQAARRMSVTMDELAHVTGGYTFNRFNDYRLHPENGNLPQRVQALPLALMGVRYPPLDARGWGESVVWLTGYDFLYQRGNDPDRLIFAARAMNSLWGAATVVLAYLWARRLWGEPGALVTGAFTALCPTLLAHSGLATSDMAMAFFLLAAPAAYWRHLQDGGWRWWWLAGAVLGLAAVAKFTAVLLLPICGLLGLARALDRAPLRLGRREFRTRAGRLAAIAASTAVQGVVAAGVIWAFFGCRYAMFNPALPAGSPNLPWPVVLDFGGAKAAAIMAATRWHLLPEGWLYGLAFVLEHARARAAFLDGEYGIFGWVDFFPRAFLYKTPPAVLLAAAAALAVLALEARRLARDRWPGAARAAAPLAALFGVYWFFSLTSHLNIGQRHILPTYPVLYLGCGVLGWAAWRAWEKSRGAGLLAGALVAAALAGTAAASLGIRPHFLAYFSPAVGGPAQGYRHLVDSSLDWGQDLPTLRDWLQAHRRPGEPVLVSYFGSDEPARFVPDAVLLPRMPQFDRPRPWYRLEPGLYAISATMLQHVYSPEFARWGPEQERAYRELAGHEAKFHLLGGPTPPTSAQLPGATLDTWERAWRQYERLRFARLCAHLRTREPDAFAGYSILIYRLDATELAAALGPGS